MKKHNRLIFFFYLIVFTTLFYCPSEKLSQSLSADKIYDIVSNSIVVVNVYDKQGELQSQGSGVVINDKGQIVTNYHILAGNDKIKILHNEETYPVADIIGINVEKDILLLKIEANNLTPIEIGDSESLTIGQTIYAIGSPLGFENTISQGIISGLRSYEKINKNFIQITASVSPGSSGGAVVNEQGQLIGISTLTAKEGQNLNFAIPINDVLNVEISSYLPDDEYKNFELFDKGFNASENGNYVEAIQYYTDYIKKYPNDATAFYNRGIAKLDLEDYRGAIRDFNKAIEINPNDATAFYNRGLAKYNLEDYRGAIQDYNKAIEINPNFAGAFNNRGSAKLDLEDYRGAIRDFNKAIEINPNDATAFYNRGLAKYALGDKYGACMDWSKSGELGNFEAYEIIKEFCK